MENTAHSETERLRRLLATGRANPSYFRAALTNISPRERDGWLDRIFGLYEVPDDGPELPRGGVPYLPSPVNTLLTMIDLAEVRSSDVFVDLGSGLGRATALTHFLTGAGAIGIEIQPALVSGSRRLAKRLNAPRVSVVEGDAARLTYYMTIGSVFFLYCPFGGERLQRVMRSLKSLSQARRLRVCSLDLPLPSCPWLTPVSAVGNLAVYRTHL